MLVFHKEMLFLSLLPLMLLTGVRRTIFMGSLPQKASPTVIFSPTPLYPNVTYDYVSLMKWYDEFPSLNLFSCRVTLSNNHIPLDEALSTANPYFPW